MNKVIFNFENAEGAETRTKKLNLLAKKHNETAIQTMVNDGWSINATTAYQAIDAGGTIRIDHSHKEFLYRQNDFTLEILESGIFSMDVTLSLAMPVNTELRLSLFVNGIDYLPNAPITALGRGATRPTSVVMIMTLELNKGDELQMKLAVDVDAIVTCTGSNSRIEKKSIG